MPVIPPRLVLAAAIAVVAACAPLPQNADEFRTMMGSHRRGRIERWQVADRPAEVAERLDTAFRYCVDREETFCSQGCTTEVHVHMLEPSTRGRTTISVRTLVSGPASRRSPEGGAFEMMVDIEGSGRTTEVTWYGGDHQLFAPYVDAIKRWSERVEHPVACPEIRQGGFRDLRRAEPAPQPAPSPEAPRAASRRR